MDNTAHKAPGTYTGAAVRRPAGRLWRSCRGRKQLEERCLHERKEQHGER